jgi:hypothetical protein
MHRGQQHVERSVDVYVVAGLRVVDGEGDRSECGLMKDEPTPSQAAAGRRVAEIGLIH